MLKIFFTRFQLTWDLSDVSNEDNKKSFDFYRLSDFYAILKKLIFVKLTIAEFYKAISFKTDFDRFLMQNSYPSCILRVSVHKFKISIK